MSGSGPPSDVPAIVDGVDSATIKSVIFDWGGTITPWHGDIDWAEPYRQAATVIYPGDPEQAAALAVELITADQAIWTQQGRASGSLEHVFASCGINDYEEAMAVILEFWEPHTYTDPDAAHTLDALRDRGVRVGLLSNTFFPRSAHDGWLGRDGVLDLFDATVYTSELPWMKPQAEAFHAAMAAVGVADPREVVFVGDRPYDDIHGAKSVGMRAVLVPHSTIPADQLGPVAGEPDAIINRLTDLVPLIDGWRAARPSTARTP